MILEKIHTRADLLALTDAEQGQLCREIREFLVRHVSRTGGHLASNLGVVETTLAIERVFDTKKDRLVFDVGHQSYVHKLLTGRYSEFSTLRSLNGISGFTRRKESTADAFISGHSSTSISAAFGIASAMRLQGRRGSVAAVIGDGALTGGMAYEGLNNAGKSKAPMVVILNDNAMSISKSTGALALYLAHIRSTKKYYCAKEHVKSLLSAVPVVGDKLERTIRTAKGLIKDAIYDSSNMFENFGFQYIGPVNGHDLEDVIEALQVAKIMRQPCVVHVFTTKGKGWKPAEENPGEYHAVTKKSSAPSGETFTEAFGRELERIGKSDSRVCGITAAMKYATGMNYFKNACPERFFDVGIAEQHAVTFAAGLAVEGMLPVFAVYSTFLQRGFDQIVHDCAIENTHVTLAVDRAGFTGEDGETHQGIFDYSYLTSIPNMSVAAPKNLWELRAMLDFAMDYKAPFAIRYPRGTAYRGLKEFMQPIAYGKGEIIYEEENIALLAVGSMVSTGEHVREKLKEEGVSCTLANARFVKPFDKELVDRLAKNHRLIVTMEENVLQGGFGLPVTAYIHEHYPQVKVMNIALPDAYVEHGNVSVLRKGLGIDSDSIIQRLKAEGWL